MLHHDNAGALPAQITYDDESVAGIPEMMREQCQIIADKLLEHYPGHPWWIQFHKNPNETGGIRGVFSIKHCLLSTLYGMVIHPHEMHGDPNLKVVVRRGGEMLERWNLDRRTLTHEDAMELMAQVPEPQFNDKKLIGRR